MIVKRKRDKMNTFYYFEGRTFETKEQALEATKDYINKNIEEIKTTRSFNDFDAEFDKLKAEGNSDFDAIEWAK